MRIGLLGFGVVGRGVYDLTSERSDMQVAKVVCLEEISLPDAEVTKDFQSVLQDETIDTVEKPWVACILLMSLSEQPSRQVRISSPPIRLWWPPSMMI